MPYHITLTVHIEPQHDGDGSVQHLAIPPQLKMNDIQVDNRIDARQGAALPGFDERPDLIRDRADGLGRDLSKAFTTKGSIKVIGMLPLEHRVRFAASQTCFRAHGSRQVVGTHAWKDLKHPNALNFSGESL